MVLHTGIRVSHKLRYYPDELYPKLFTFVAFLAILFHLVQLCQLNLTVAIKFMIMSARVLLQVSHKHVDL